MISPTRALLISHFQAGWNRAIREMGRNGAVGMVIAAVSIGFFALFPMTAGLGFAGFALGRHLEAPWAPAALGAIFTAMAFGGGLLGGILGGAKTLDWERLRGFPLRRGQIFAAELVAGLGDLLALMFTVAMASLALGLAIAVPTRVLFVLILLLASLLTLLAIQLLVGGLATALLRHLKTALFVVLGLAWIASVALGSFGQKSPRRSVKEAPASARIETVDEAKARALVLKLQTAARALPATQSAIGLQEPNLLRASLRQLPMLILAGLLAWLAARLLWRETVQEAQSLVLSAAQAKLWTFSRPAYGLARLQWRTLMGSMIGRFAFLIPVIAVVLIKGPMARAGGTAVWAVPGAFVYLAFGAAQLLFNMFGLDQGAVKGLLLLPIAPKELLLGKSLGYGLFMGLQGALLGLLLAIFGGPGIAARIPAGLCLFAACALAMGAVGLWSSIAMPRPLSRKKLGSGGMPLPMILLSMGTSLGCAGLFGGLFALLAWAAPAWLLPGMALSALVMVAVFRAGLEVAAAYLGTHRERLVERLG